MTVSKPYQNPISNDDWSCRSSEEQIPQIVESNKNRVEIWEPKEAYYSLDTQEVTDSSSVKPTTSFSNLRPRACGLLRGCTETCTEG
jgi:hypothetical protein